MVGAWPPACGQDRVCEEDRFPVLRALVAVTVVAGAFRIRRADPVARAGRRRRGSRRRWCLLPRPPLRSPVGLTVPAAGRGRRSDVEDRDRHRGHRHALREPVLHGGGRRGRRPPRRRPAAARHQPRVARAGHRRLALLRLPAGRGRDRRRHGTAPRRGVPRAPRGRGLRRAESATDVPEPAGPAAPRAPFARTARADLVGRGVAGDRGVGGRAGHESDELDAGLRRCERRPLPRHASAPHPRVPRGVARGRARARLTRLCQPEHLCPRERHGSRVLRPRATTTATTSVSSTRTRGRSSAAPTRRSPTCSSRSSPRTRRSRPPTRSC